ncbi:haloacid dehalogenase type II [Usitatibacter palustris]|uniref:(S)-2-haloacid dehalogenase n=1 Tax=Usitatibacter palustris TaxID=2732487 RepID=A0A6M4H973_9PROT|nr:haloacid dehalogenase type II [Usitatibacter palustris]QJR16126.1 (S)-2-haloacid dehalogenase [Usitatibacter palustris]
MALEISALVFDAYGTLFDVHSVARKAEALYPGKGDALSRAWRTKQLEYTWLRSLMGNYEDFSRVTLASLEWALESLKIVPGDADKSALFDEYRKLAMFPEVPAALDSFARARPLAILSNGHPDMLEAVVEHNRLRNLFRGGVLSVHAAKVFKPNPATYHLVEERLGVPRALVGFVSSNGWDAAGAKAFGFKAFWVNRTGQPVERLGVRPDAVVPDLASLAEMLAK